MRNIQIALIVVSLLALVAFCFSFGYQRFFADTEPPVFICEQDTVDVSVQASREELCAGLRAEDEVDGDISDRIQVKSISSLIGARTAQVTYVVFDEASNAAAFTRSVNYTDYEKPHFRLEKPLIYNVSQTVTLLDRLSVSDVADGDLTEKMRLTMLNLETSTPGNYQIRVMVTNSLGDSAILPLTVIIRNASINAPTIELTDYLVYTPVGQELDPKRFIRSAKDPTKPGSTVSPSDISIHSNVDYSIPGTYEITYSYTGSTGQDYTVILTVVVE